MLKTYFRQVLGVCIILLCGVLAGCVVEKNSCVTCHTDKEKLKELAKSIEAAEEDTGEG